MASPDRQMPPQSGADVVSRFPADASMSAGLRRFFACWLDTFIFESTLPAELRELAILRVMWRCGQSFEWANHYRIARGVGLSRNEILSVRTESPEGDLTPARATVVRAADDVVDTGRVSPATLAQVRSLFPEAATVQEFLYLVAGYRMFATVSATEGTTAASQGLPIWPPDGIGPAASH